PARQVEVEEHRLAIGGEQDVGRLEVEVHQAALMGVLESIRQGRSEPADGLRIRGPVEEGPGRVPGWDLHGQSSLKSLDGLAEVAPGSLRQGYARQLLEDLGQRRPA